MFSLKSAALALSALVLGGCHGEEHHHDHYAYRSDRDWHDDGDWHDWHHHGDYYHHRDYGHYHEWHDAGYYRRGYFDH